MRVPFTPPHTMYCSTQAARRLAVRPLSRRWTRPYSQLNSVTEADLAHFSQILPPPAILSTLSSATSADLETYNNDWMNKYHGRSTTVLRPRTTQEVSAIVRHCNERRIGIVPQGGNTGLVGGSVPVKDELVLSLGSMNSVRSFDDASGMCASLYCIRGVGDLDRFCVQVSSSRMRAASCSPSQTFSYPTTTSSRWISAQRAGMCLLRQCDCA